MGSSSQNSSQRASFAVCFAAVWVWVAPVVHSTMSSLRPSHFTIASPVFLQNETPLYIGGERGYFQSNKSNGFSIPPGGPSFLFIFIDPLCFSHLSYNLTIAINCTFNSFSWLMSTHES